MDNSGQNTSCVIRMVNLSSMIVKIPTDQEKEAAMRGVEVEVEVEVGLQIIRLPFTVGGALITFIVTWGFGGRCSKNYSCLFNTQIETFLIGKA